MKKFILAIGFAAIASTSALAQSSALDVVGQKIEVNASAIDYEATASIGTTASETRDRLGDGSPMVGGRASGAIAIETGYLPEVRLGGNS
jgi:hypothetical protein